MPLIDCDVKHNYMYADNCNSNGYMFPKKNYHKNQNVCIKYA